MRLFFLILLTLALSGTFQRPVHGQLNYPLPQPPSQPSPSPLPALSPCINPWDPTDSDLDAGEPGQTIDMTPVSSFGSQEPNWTSGGWQSTMSYDEPIETVELALPIMKTQPTYSFGSSTGDDIDGGCMQNTVIFNAQDAGIYTVRVTLASGSLQYLVLVTTGKATFHGVVQPKKNCPKYVRTQEWTIPAWTKGAFHIGNSDPAEVTWKEQAYVIWNAKPDQAVVVNDPDTGIAAFKTAWSNNGENPINAVITGHGNNDYQIYSQTDKGLVYWNKFGPSQIAKDFVAGLKGKISTLVLGACCTGSSDPFQKNPQLLHWLASNLSDNKVTASVSGTDSQNCVVIDQPDPRFAAKRIYWCTDQRARINTCTGNADCTSAAP